jgi:hypothetical protein
MIDSVMDQSTRERLTEAARACRILEMEGHGDMTLGHLSVRDFVLVGWDGKQIADDGADDGRSARSDNFNNAGNMR